MSGDKRPLTLSLSKGERAQGWGNAAAFKLRWGWAHD